MKRRLTVSAVIIVIVALNAWILWRLRASKQPLVPVRDSDAEKIAHREKAADVVSEWSGKTGIPLLNADLSLLVASIPTANCRAHPDGAELIDIANLDSQQRADLSEATAGFLRAYMANKANAILDYMRSRDEIIPEQTTQLGRQVLVANGYPENDVAALSDEGVFSDCWKTLKYSTAWSQLVPSESCISVWRFKSSDAKEFPPLVNSVRDLRLTFGTATVFSHRFTPRVGSFLESVQNDGGKSGILIAEALLLIEHDAEHFNGRWPYVARLWYQKASQKWHPLDLVLVSPDAKGISFPF